MIEKRVDLTMITAFRALRKNAFRGKYLRAAFSEYVEEKGPMHIQKRAFGHWNALNQQRVKMYKMYAFTVL